MLLRISVFCVLLLCSARCVGLPKWTRQYNMPCGACHSVPPRLNDFGRAFQANNFTIPGMQLSVRKSAIPISGIATFSAEENRNGSAIRFRTLKLFAVESFYFGGSRSGVYYANPIAFSDDPTRKGGSVDDIYLTIPVAGIRGEWTATVGQWMPITNQWSSHNLFTRSPPAALQLGIDDFSFAGHSPGFRMDYFDGRGTDTADGNYVCLGVPFSGHVDFAERSRIGKARGIFAHAFQRRSANSLGGFAYSRSGRWLGGALFTRDLGARYSLWVIGAMGADSARRTNRLSIEADRYFGGRLALTGRLDWVDGSLSPTAALTFFPFRLPILRTTFELNQSPGNRSAALLARGLF